MIFRQVHLGSDDRRRLLELVQEVSAGVDQIDSDEGLDALEEELGIQWSKVLRQKPANVLQNNTSCRVIWTWRHPLWMVPGLGLAALVMILLVKNARLYKAVSCSQTIPTQLQVTEADGRKTTIDRDLANRFHFESVDSASL